MKGQLLSMNTKEVFTVWGEVITISALTILL